MIKTCFQWWIETQGFLPSSQLGFRTGRSCSDNLTALILTIEDAFCKNETILACFLDVKGVFDNVNCDVLLTKLSELGCSHNVLSLAQFVTYERNVTFLQFF